MPKALSLKKAQPTNVPKNQKSILGFFKSVLNGASQKDGPLQSQHLESVGTQKSKRKATSPTTNGSNIDLDEYCVNNVRNINNTRTLKKPKTEGSPTKNPSNVFKKSPNKENIVHTTISPKKQVLKVSPNSEISALLSNDNIPTSCIDESENKQSCKNGTTLSHKYSVTPVNQASPSKSNKNHDTMGKRTPRKSPLQEFQCSPIKLMTPEKSVKDVLSPSKCGSTVKVLDFDDVGDEFADEWDIDGIEDGVDDLDLSTMQRCEILSVSKHAARTELRLQNAHNHRGTCFVEGIWLNTPLLPGDTISCLAHKDSSGHYTVTNSSGLLVLRPDHLVSSTSVVGGVFCKRKTVFQTQWRGIDPGNAAMTTGILVHELVQKALTDNITSADQLRIVTDNIVKESIQMLYDAGMSEEEARANIYNYIPPLADFMESYVVEKPTVAKKAKKDKNQWLGHIDKVLDIEENLCCPKLGLKGKIDATLQVTVHDNKGSQRSIVPLELKSGKASMSAEHRGQLVLYGMMLNLHNSDDPTVAAQKGLLLYLKDRVELREVSCGYPERRDLIMLRNELVQYLAGSPDDIDPEQLTDIEDASIMLQQKLPEPVDHHSACSKCPYLTICSLHLWHTCGPSVPSTHALTKLKPEALGHLSLEHIQYFLRWTALLKMEERGQSVTSPLHLLWTESVDKREKRGTCASNLKLKSVESSGDRFLHILQRTSDCNIHSKVTKGPQEGEYSIVSIDNRPWIAAGIVTVTNNNEIHILLERDLSRRNTKATVYHIDTYESYASTIQNMTNLGVLMEDSERAERLRKIIIDKAAPEFEAKLPREVGRLGTKMMRSLNIQQQRAVLKALAAKDYALLQGLPGTGKTQTISVLIQMLVSLKQRVLVTAHTHSAVDTLLCRLPESVRVMRLGSSARVSVTLHTRTELALTKHCDTTEQLAQVYDSMEVVGVTCLGAAHAMLARTTFDICIVDEATQVLQCTVLRPLFAAKKFVLVGDPEQLPPVVRSRGARRLGMEESLFHRLMCEEATSTLQLQYRMNEALAAVANHVAYSDRLKCADEKIAQAKMDIDLQKISHLTTSSPWLTSICSPDATNAAVFLDVATMSIFNDKNPCANSLEACVVVAVVDALITGNINPSDIGVIAPYRDQVSLLRRAVSHLGVEVSTVDQFQGRDKSVIVYSCTRHDTKEDKKVKEGEVLNDQRRLAVSVTRAKHKLLVIGNSTALHRYQPLHKLIQTCKTVPLDVNVLNSLVQKYKSFVS